MFDRFTDNARKAMALARKEALRLQHDIIGTEHLLLALIGEKEFSAARVLESLGVDLGRFRGGLDKVVEPGSSPPLMQPLPFTKGAKEVLEQAMAEANELGHNYIGTEHLLLGLFRVKMDFASEALLAAGLKLEEVRDQVRKLLSLQDPTPRGRQGVPMSEIMDLVQAAQYGLRRIPRTMLRAQEEAQRFHHDFIGTEHLLLALLAEEACAAVEVLETLGADLLKLRNDLEKMVEPGSSSATVGQLPFTPQAKEAVERSREEARELSYHDPGTEHLLLGLFRVKQGLAAEALLAAGLKLEEVRDQVRKLAPLWERGEPQSRGRSMPGHAPSFSQQAVSLARAEAHRQGHGFVGLGHLLLGLLREGGPAAEILKDLGITLEKIEPQAEKLLQFDLAAITAKDLPVLPLAARALLRSKHEAEILGAKEVRSEHLLLGLLGEPDGAAARILRDLGLDLEEVRRQALRKETTLGIEVRKGLEAVREHPDRYIGGRGQEGLHHLVFTVLDNSIDEALVGHCRHIELKIHRDGYVSVLDDGRGIAAEMIEREGRSALEVVMTGPCRGGGPLGVGVSVVNALSEKMVVEAYREVPNNPRQRIAYRQTYEKGIPTSPVTTLGQVERRGTLIRFKPDLSIMEAVEFQYEVLAKRCRELAFRNRDLQLHIHILDERTGKEDHFQGEKGDQEPESGFQAPGEEPSS